MGEVSRLISLAQMRELGIDFTKRNIDRLEAAGQFPHRVYLSARRVAWVRQEILDYIDAKIAVRDDIKSVIVKPAATARAGKRAQHRAERQNDDRPAD